MKSYNVLVSKICKASLVLEEQDSFVFVAALENLCDWGQAGVSFPQVAENLVLDIKLLVYKAFKTIRSYGANVKESNSIVLV